MSLQRVALKTAVVDDEEVFAKELCDQLGKRGLSCTPFFAARTALAHCNAYDSLILDLMMPEMSGFELMDKIRTRYPTKPLVVLTNHPEMAPKAKATDANIEAFFDKAKIRRELPELVGVLESLETVKQKLGDGIARCYQCLQEAKDSNKELLERHESLLGVKEWVRGQLWDRLKDASPERRRVAAMLTVALNSVSLVPSPTYGLKAPSSNQLDTLCRVFITLGRARINSEHLASLDRELAAVGLHTGLEIEDTSPFESVEDAELSVSEGELDW